MHVNELITDDGAVSPVIGVVLMVAITVILAAVVGSVVLGIGAQAREDPPRASFSFSYDAGPAGDTGVVHVTHESGDPIDGQSLYLRGSGFTDVSGAFPEQDMSSAGQWQGTVSGPNSAVVSGDSVVVGVSSEYDVRVVYQSDGTSTTLTVDRGPGG